MFYLFFVLWTRLDFKFVTGADVIHPAPGSEGRPSFTGVVANVDSASAKYIAQTRVQVSRKEMIDHLEEMSEVGIHYLLTNCTALLTVPLFSLSN